MLVLALVGCGPKAQESAQAPTVVAEPRHREPTRVLSPRLRRIRREIERLREITAPPEVAKQQQGAPGQ